MQEIDEGLWYWTATHPKIGWEVSSYYLSGERVLIDPVLPPGGLDWFQEIDAIPAHVLLSCRHHDRASWKIVDAFGAEVHCVDAGVDELKGRGAVTPFAFGDELPGNVIAREVNSISPDETAPSDVAGSIDAPAPIAVATPALTATSLHRAGALGLGPGQPAEQFGQGLELLVGEALDEQPAHAGDMRA